MSPSFLFPPSAPVSCICGADGRPLAQEFSTSFGASGQGLGGAELSLGSKQFGAGSIGRFHARNRESGAGARHCLSQPGFMQ